METVGILDDDTNFCGFFKSVVNRYYNIDIKVFNSVNIKDLLNPNLKLLFIDIDLGEENGIEVAKKLREHNSEVRIIFISQYNGLSNIPPIIKPSFFIRKSFLQVDFLEAAKCREIKKLLSINVLVVDGRVVDFKEVNYIESNDHYVDLHCDNINIRTRDRISRLADLLEIYDFKRVHRSFVVNFDKVNKVDNQEITLKDGTVITVGRKYKECINNFKKGF